MKIDKDGEYQWHTFYGGLNVKNESDYNDIGYSIFVENEESLYITGSSYDPWEGPSGEAPLNPHTGPDGYDIFVLKLDLDGDYLWHSFYGAQNDPSGLDLTEWGRQIVGNGTGDFFITGQSEAPWNGPGDTAPLNPHSGYSDALIMKLTEEL